MAVEIGLIVASILCVSLYTLLYGDQPISRIAEHIYIGFGAYWIVNRIMYFWREGVERMLEPGQAHFVIPVILGLMILGRLYKPTRWMYRYPMALIIGSSIGVSLRTMVFSQIIDQYVVGNLPPTTPLIGVPAVVTINSLIIIFGTICSTAFFIFSHDFTGPTKYIHRAGRLFLLCAFGATYGQTTSYRYEAMAGNLITNMFRPPELIPYTLGFIAIAAIALVAFKKTGILRTD